MFIVISHLNFNELNIIIVIFAQFLNTSFDVYASTNLINTNPQSMLNACLRVIKILVFILSFVK